jgi:glutamate-1-semialdehyde 2,1-aminomutase
VSLVGASTDLEARYRAATPRSGARFARARRLFPAGTAKGAYYHAPYPVHLVAGEGCHVVDADGRRYLDFRGHHTAMVAGHGHPAVLAAVREQLARGVALGGPTDAEWELAEELCARVPSLERVRFTTSGSEATLHAVRLARGATGRPLIAKFEGAYHGGHDALEVSVRPPLADAGPVDEPRAVPDARGSSAAAAAEALILPYGSRAGVERLLRRHRERVAAVIFDPKAGIYDVDPGLPAFLRDLTAELGVPLIFDEVVSFRLARGGFQELCGVTPDLTTFGKVIGGGLPVGAFGGRADLLDLLDPAGGRPGFFQSGTFSGHPLAMAAGHATVRLLDGASIGRLDALGERVRAGLADLFRRTGTPARAVVRGSLFSVYFGDRPVTDYRAAAGADRARAHRVFLALLNRGLLLAPGLTMNALSLPMDESHVEALLTGFAAALAEAAAAEAAP